MEILQAKPFSRPGGKLRMPPFGQAPKSATRLFHQSLNWIKSLGWTAGMDEYERRKLSVFNFLNFLQLVTGLLYPILGLIHQDSIPNKIWLLALVPCAISLGVLVLNYRGEFGKARLIYFILYPFFTGFVYLQGMFSGVQLHFLLYGVMAVFILQDMGYMLFTIALSMVNYFLLNVVLKYFIYDVRTEFKVLYYINELIALGFIFYGLYLIKRENNEYQVLLLQKQRKLHAQKLEIEEQKEIISAKAEQLELQKEQLADLDVVKTKLFTVIAHDLKSPLYAMRQLFRNMHQSNTPAEQVKAYVPEVLMDLNYTIGLMENLLQWSKAQMKAASVRPEELDISKMIDEVIHLLRLQAEAKQINIERAIAEPVFVTADKDMVSLVLRNLVSNAIKFTPQQGQIEIGVNDLSAFVEVYVQDNGAGISRDGLRKINEGNFYSTKGTASESGTGLGLMLCKEFLAKNGGQMHIESEVGVGSVFSFTLPRE